MNLTVQHNCLRVRLIQLLQNLCMKKIKKRTGIKNTGTLHIVGYH